MPGATRVVIFIPILTLPGSAQHDLAVDVNEAVRAYIALQATASLVYFGYSLCFCDLDGLSGQNGTLSVQASSDILSTLLQEHHIL